MNKRISLIIFMVIAMIIVIAFALIIGDSNKGLRVKITENISGNVSIENVENSNTTEDYIIKEKITIDKKYLKMNIEKLSETQIELTFFDSKGISIKKGDEYILSLNGEEKKLVLNKGEMIELKLDTTTDINASWKIKIH